MPEYRAIFAREDIDPFRRLTRRSEPTRDVQPIDGRDDLLFHALTLRIELVGKVFCEGRELESNVGTRSEGEEPGLHVPHSRRWSVFDLEPYFDLGAITDTMRDVSVCHVQRVEVQLALARIEGIDEALRDQPAPSTLLEAFATGEASPVGDHSGDPESRAQPEIADGIGHLGESLEESSSVVHVQPEPLELGELYGELPCRGLDLAHDVERFRHDRGDRRRSSTESLSAKLTMNCLGWF